MTVTLKDLTGAALYAKTLAPQRVRRSNSYALNRLLLTHQTGFFEFFEVVVKAV
jgi:hypothetical protein